MTAGMRATIRPVEKHDVDAVVGLVHELADYERAPEHCLLTTDQLHDGAVRAVARACTGTSRRSPTRTGGPRSSAARSGSSTSRPGGACTASTSKTCTSSPRTAAPGIGRALLARLAAVCAERGLARLEWAVLDWNAPSIGFYRSLGAVEMDEWTVFRLDGAALAALGEES